MSGILNLMVGIQSRVNPLSDQVITLTAGSLSVPGGLGDARHYGYSSTHSIGTRSPTTLSGFTISEVRESLTFLSTNGTYTTIVHRRLTITLTSGPERLYQNDIAQIQPPLQGLYTGAQATFTGAADGGQWVWTLPDGTDDASPDFLSNGDLILTA